MLVAEILQQSPVLIAYADDVEQRASALSLAGAELLHLPGTNGKVDLTALMSALAQRGTNEILLEAGQNLNGAFLEANLIDEFIFYYAPKLMGNAAHAMFVMPELSDMQQVKAYSITDVRQLGQDLRLRLSTRS
jgi:diaminohydroxyphosphoribosylaminopyrimidine deaminase/5-amino-6-(5-phosphoribosylamino)uracil reductase